MAAVSATIGRTLSKSIPSVSAAIIARDARVPLRSMLPVATTTVPSSLTCTDALDSPPLLNQ